jgi:hypothetical protein
MEVVAREPLIENAKQPEGAALAGLRASVRKLLIQHDAANYHANPAALKARTAAAYARALRDVIRLIDRRGDQ